MYFVVIKRNYIYKKKSYKLHECVLLLFLCKILIYLDQRSMQIGSIAKQYQNLIFKLCHIAVQHPGDRTLNSLQSFTCITL